MTTRYFDEASPRIQVGDHLLSLSQFARLDQLYQTTRLTAWEIVRLTSPQLSMDIGSSAARTGVTREAIADRWWQDRREAVRAAVIREAHCLSPDVLLSDILQTTGQRLGAPANAPIGVMTWQDAPTCPAG